MEEGFRVDVHTLMNLKRSYELLYFNLKKEMQEKLGKPFRVDSNRELGNLLFNNLCLPSLRRTPTGNPSVSIDVLERLRDSYSNFYPFLKSVIEFRTVHTLIKSVKPSLRNWTCKVGFIPSSTKPVVPLAESILTSRTYPRRSGRF